MMNSDDISARTYLGVVIGSVILGIILSVVLVLLAVPVIRLFG